jgi:hypothetical protein
MLSNIVMKLPSWHKYDDELIPLALELLHSLTKRGFLSVDIDRIGLAKALIQIQISYTTKRENDSESLLNIKNDGSN